MRVRLDKSSRWRFWYRTAVERTDVISRRPSTEKYVLRTLGARPRSRWKNGKFFHPLYTCGQTVLQNKVRFQSSCTWHCACTSKSVGRYLTASSPAFFTRGEEGDYLNRDSQRERMPDLFS